MLPRGKSWDSNQRTPFAKTHARPHARLYAQVHVTGYVRPASLWLVERFEDAKNIKDLTKTFKEIASLSSSFLVLEHC